MFGGRLLKEVKIENTPHTFDWQSNIFWVRVNIVESEDNIDYSLWNVMHDFIKVYIAININRKLKEDTKYV